MDGRVRLRQWLEGRLNTGYIPGLIWLDKSKGIFKIPWKHHSKHTWHEDDAAIFKDWAIVTGRFREGLDPPDWPMWKTRLRCALNKAPDIEEARQHHNLHCDEPFKVYRFVSRTESVWRANASRHASLIFDGAGALSPLDTPNQQQTQIRRRSNQSDSIASAGVPPSSVAPLPLRPTQQQTSAANVSHKRLINTSHSLLQHERTTAVGKPITLIRKSPQQHTRHITLKCITLPALKKSSLTPCLSTVTTTGQQPKLVRAAAVAPGNDYFLSSAATTNPITYDINSEHNPHYHSHNISLNTSTHHNLLYCNSPGNLRNRSRTTADSAALLSSSYSNNSLSFSDVIEPELHQMCLRIQHLQHRVSDLIVNNPNGCCIYFGRLDESLTCSGPEPVEPQLDSLVAERDRYCVDMLLENMQRGVVLSTGEDGSLYAEKLCKCATFVYRPIVSHSRQQQLQTSSDCCHELLSSSPPESPATAGSHYHHRHRQSSPASFTINKYELVDKLSRRRRVQIFDYCNFRQQLLLYKQGVIQDPPSVELVLAFGQQIRPGASPDSLYIWCRLASCKAWFLLQKSELMVTTTVYSGGATRLIPRRLPNHNDGYNMDDEECNNGSNDSDDCIIDGYQPDIHRSNHQRILPRYYHHYHQHQQQHVKEEDGVPQCRILTASAGGDSIESELISISECLESQQQQHGMENVDNEVDSIRQSLHPDVSVNGDVEGELEVAHEVSISDTEGHHHHHSLL